MDLLSVFSALLNKSGTAQRRKRAFTRPTSSPDSEPLEQRVHRVGLHGLGEGSREAWRLTPQHAGVHASPNLLRDIGQERGAADRLIGHKQSAPRRAAAFERRQVLVFQATRRAVFSF